MEKKIIVVIVTYNAMEWAERCFNSIRNSSIPVEVFVIDNGSKDGTQNFILTHYPEIHFLQSEENLGFGKANNIGLKYALEHDYDYVYLLNQDAWIYNDTIEKLINTHEKYPYYGILSPMQLQANGNSLDDNFAQMVCSYNSNKEIISDFYFGVSKPIYPVAFVMAAHWLVSRNCLKKVGGFSPTFPHYGEDNNYIDRAVYHGFKVGIVPKAKAVHDREYRQNNNRKIISFTYTNSLIICSNLNETSVKKLFQCIMYTLKASLYYKSFIPYKYFIKILFQWNIIMHNVKISKSQDTAFIINK